MALAAGVARGDLRLAGRGGLYRTGLDWMGVSFEVLLFGLVVWRDRLRWCDMILDCSVTLDMSMCMCMDEYEYDR